MRSLNRSSTMVTKENATTQIKKLPLIISYIEMELPPQKNIDLPSFRPIIIISISIIHYLNIRFCKSKSRFIILWLNTHFVSIYKTRCATSGNTLNKPRVKRMSHIVEILQPLHPQFRDKPNRERAFASTLI